jgi:hypothetical protein
MTEKGLNSSMPTKSYYFQADLIGCGTLLGAGEVKLVFWALRWKDSGDCIQIVTIGTVGECPE